MPPDVIGEAVVDRPVRCARAQELDAVADASLHLHDMRDGVHSPGIARVCVERLATGVLGPVVQTRLLKPEGVHPEHIAVAGHGCVPARQHLRHAVAKHRRLPEEEVADVCHLHCEQVTGVVDDDVPVAAHAAGEIALHPAPCGRHVGTFPVGCAGSQRFDGLDALPDHRQGAALRRHHAQRRPQAMTHGERRVPRERAIDGRERIEEIGCGQGQRFLEALHGLGVAARDIESAAVLQFHAFLQGVQSSLDSAWVGKLRGRRQRDVSTGVKKA